jgi:MFS family permease
VFGSYLPLLRQERRILLFGMLMTFSSSFGQTFFVSLFVPAWEREFALGSGLFGSIYSLATLMSAGLLPIVGRWVDVIDLRRYALIVALGLGISCLGLALVGDVWQLLIALFGLRLFGQGLCGHIASTTMARRFQTDRGKALSVSALGYPIGEGIVPTLGILAIAAWGWRKTSLVDGALVFCILIPLIVCFLAPAALRTPPANLPPNSSDDPLEKEWTRSHVLRDWRFYSLLPGFLIIPFGVTGLIIHQVRLAEFKGWSLSTFAYAFTGFAVARIVGSLLAGPAIDRWGARRLFPFIAFPMAAGIALLMAFDSPWIALAYLSLTGASIGMASGTGSALWAELYGVRHLGAIKSMGSSLAVFGTALSPALFGWMLGAEISFHWILCGTIGLVGVASAISLPVCLGKSALGKTRST